MGATRAEGTGEDVRVHRVAQIRRANTLMVMMDFAERDALVEEDPGTYYLKEHYLNYPCVLVRLSRISAEALRDLITGAHRFVSAKVRRKSVRSSRRGVARQSRAR
jgi:hypothetical protein